MHAACFLDRDGVIIEDVGYLSDPGQIVLIDGAAPSIARLNAASVPVVVITNQAGVARGYFPEERIATVHEELSRLLRPYHARIDRFYYCPHHPTAGRGDYKVACDCRKPNPGMLLAASADLTIDLPRSFFIGDKLSDLGAAENAGCRGILVRTGYGADYDSATLAREGWAPAFVARDLGDAVDFCLPSLTTPSP